MSSISSSAVIKVIFLISLLHHQFHESESQCVANKFYDSMSYQIDAGSKFLEVPCDQQIENGLWTVVMNRFDGSVAFHNRTEEEYKQGFGNFRTGEYFIGLDALSALTNDRQMELLFVATDRYNDTAMYKYSEFRFGYSTSEYRVVSHGSFTGAPQYDGGFGKLAFCKFLFTQKPVVGWKVKEGGGNCWHSNIFGDYPYSGFYGTTDLCWGSYGSCVGLTKLRMLVRPVNPYIKAEAKDH